MKKPFKHKRRLGFVLRMICCVCQNSSSAIDVQCQDNTFSVVLVIRLILLYLGDRITLTFGLYHFDKQYELVIYLPRVRASPASLRCGP